jgi:UDP:flavonoid glycosyltransferase YjiC (YdhE family)
MMPLALALAEAGAEVTIATGDAFRDRLPVPTVQGFTPGWSFADGMAETVARLGAPQRPNVDFANTMFAEVNGRRVFAEEYADRGLAAPASLDDLALSRFEIFPEFLREPGTKPDLDVVDLRPVAWNEPGPVPDRLRSPATRPRAYLTLGTVFADGGLLVRTARELAEAGFEVLMALGPAVPESQLADLPALPASVHVERFVDQAAVLDLVDVVVHHGGSGTALGALARGLPQLLVPQGADQFWNAERLVAEGAVRSLSGAVPDGALGEAAAAVVVPDSAERTAAARLGALTAARPSPAQVAAELIALR